MAGVESVREGVEGNEEREVIVTVWIAEGPSAILHSALSSTSTGKLLGGFTLRRDLICVEPLYFYPPLSLLTIAGSY